MRQELQVSEPRLHPIDLAVTGFHCKSRGHRERLQSRDLLSAARFTKRIQLYCDPASPSFVMSAPHFLVSAAM